MIISHAHKFIFLKTKKTAGTSIELALSQLCGPDDVIPPITESDETLRAPGSEPRNWRVHGWWQSPRPLFKRRWFKVGPHRLDIGLQATNVFDTRVIYRVDQITGKGRVWGVGEYSPAAFVDVDEDERARIMANTKAGEVDDPANYGPGVQWRLTIDYDF